ncbi:hypothetical protein DPMN_069608 [Dreissena polymorpha]|uniref:Uncharacterized protein n=1 Tax=Dreissena polymorpha TaxID=45954 RepID=A0A9D3Z3V6_DREPO|nr:hypothetical protein DPMN_069608 [Dreissena polymorpha]
MNSDTDELWCFKMFVLVLDSEAPTVSLNNSESVVIVVSTLNCAPQYCQLTLTEPVKQEKNFCNYSFQCWQSEHFQRNALVSDFFDHLKNENETLTGNINNNILHKVLRQKEDVIKQSKWHGPAQLCGNKDNVYAFYCKSLPPECNFIFEWPRPDHWPSEKTSKKARKYGAFIVPQGPHISTNISKYDDSYYYWRISTNLTERELMFSLGTVI